MGTPLSVLIVEDSEDDALLSLRELRRGGFDVSFERVQTAPDMRAALDKGGWDLILSDYTMPSFSAPEAFGVLRSRDLDVPFIIISGTVGEETAVLAMKLGVHDYLVKGKLARLVPAVERELREAEGRRAHRRAEKNLSVAEAKYLAIFEASPLAMWVFNIETLGFVAVNEAAVRQYGYSRAEFMGMTLVDIRPEEDAEANREAASTGASSQGAEPGQHRRKDGSIVLVEIEAHDLVFAGRAARLVLVIDVTERMRVQEALRVTEEQLRQSQKMEAVGRLAGGVAHDFNNILSIILSYCGMTLGELREGDPIRDDIREIQKAGERAAELTKQLLMFSRHQLIERRVLDLTQVLMGMEKMIRRLLGADVEVTFLPSTATGKVIADAGQIEQVVMNLVVNARDAMPRGGKLVLETRNVELDEEYVRTHFGVVPGSYVLLALSDTGFGMSKDVQARVFEPFFTTKEKDKGTGLGLSTVFGIVKQSGGHVWLYSEPGQGTTFKIYLPRTAVQDDEKPSVPPSTGAGRGSETILLVEDDEQVRAVACNILRRHGYRVLEASNGGEALLSCEQHTATIHLLLTDVILPKVSGRQIAERLAALRPEMKVLFMSGYTDEAILQQGVLDADVAYFQKPITPEKLTRAVREVLNRPRR
jgi:PAS domain S-box-containing protein